MTDIKNSHCLDSHPQFPEQQGWLQAFSAHSPISRQTLCFFCSFQEWDGYKLHQSKPWTQRRSVSGKQRHRDQNKSFPKCPLTGDVENLKWFYKRGEPPEVGWCSHSRLAGKSWPDSETHEGHFKLAVPHGWETMLWLNAHLGGSFPVLQAN